MSESEETRSEQIIIRVKPSKKQDWVDAADENGFGSLARAIRTAFDNEFLEDEQEMEAGGVEADIDFEPVEQKLDLVLERMESLENQVSNIGMEVDEDVMGFAYSILPMLPEAESPDELPMSGEVNEEEVDVVFSETGAVSDVLEFTSRGEFEVRKALDFLESSAGVESDTLMGERRYYRTEESNV